MMETRGTHVLVDVWLDDALPAEWRAPIPELLKAHGLEVVGGCSHSFEPQGETAVWLLAESHCSIHTYPEHGYASLDVYGCGGDPVGAANAILERWPVSHMRTAVLDRGV